MITGNNESGKSSMLPALDLVLSEGRHQVELPGIKTLLSQQAYPGQASVWFHFQSD